MTKKMRTKVATYSEAAHMECDLIAEHNGNCWVYFPFYGRHTVLSKEVLEEVPFKPGLFRSAKTDSNCEVRYFAYAPSRDWVRI
jgi:hypothetical protein